MNIHGHRKGHFLRKTIIPNCVQNPFRGYANTVVLTKVYLICVNHKYFIMCVPGMSIFMAFFVLLLIFEANMPPASANIPILGK